MQNVTEISDVTKKRKNDTEDEVAAKKRKVEIDNGDDSDDICIISNDDAPHDNSSELKKLALRKRKLSDDIDCLIVCDDDND